MTEQDAMEEARDNIGRAIQAYQDIVNPGEYVTDWAVVTQRNSIALEQEGRRSVGLLCAESQSFITTRGLLEYAIEIERTAGVGRGSR